MVVAVVGVVVLLGAVGTGAVWFGANWNRSPAEGNPPSDDYYGKAVDSPRKAPTYDHPGGTGGTTGVALENALASSGYSCGRTVGNRSAVLSCFLSEDEPAPNLARVTALVVGKSVVHVEASVEVDPAWTELDPDPGNSFDRFTPDVSAVAGRTFGIVALATIPDGERPAVDKAMRESYEQRGTEVVETSAGRVNVTMAPNARSSFRLTHPDRPGGRLDYESGPSLVTPKEIESAVGPAGLDCRRTPESMTCTEARVEVAVTFPKPQLKGSDHDVTKLMVTAPAAPGGSPDKRFVDTVEAVTALVVGKSGDSAPVEAWARHCFDDATHLAAAGASELRCTPALAGAVKSPTVEAYTFTVEPLDY